ncbi:MAG TPA: SMP-30/gluconolactonase/LRE family protein [Streptosporangiaceae bacterium]|nr:SMP-30/gluconolactonase/LRE family protein [Streptosporangiaceae bacterium]
MITSYQAEVALPSQAELGEGPTWDDRTRSLLWVDIVAGRIHRFRPDLGTDVSAGVRSTLGAVSLRADGGLVLALTDGLGLASASQVRAALPEDARRLAPGGRHAGVTLGYQRVPGFAVAGDEVRFNEGKADPEGRFLAGTMDWHEREALGSLYQLEPGGRVSRLLGDVTISNGLDVSDDRRILYYVDSAAGGIDAFDRDPGTGRLSSRRRVAEVPRSDGILDGLTLDSDGCLWVAVFGGGQVRRYAPDGRLIGMLEIPARQVTSVGFGGARLDELFITTARIGQPPEALARQPRAGDLFWCQPGVSGRPWPRFAG